MRMRVGVSVVILVLALVNMESPQSALGQEKGAQDNGNPEDIIRRRVDLVSVYFTVRDNKKHLVSDLPQDQFSVTEDGRPQEIKFFAHHSDVVLNVGVLLDTGTNMPSILGEEAQASALFVRHVVRPTDLGHILSYASRVEMVQLRPLIRQPDRRSSNLNGTGHRGRSGSLAEGRWGSTASLSI